VVKYYNDKTKTKIKGLQMQNKISLDILDHLTVEGYVGVSLAGCDRDIEVEVPIDEIKEAGSLDEAMDVVYDMLLDEAQEYITYGVSEVRLSNGDTISEEDIPFAEYPLEGVVGLEIYVENGLVGCRKTEDVEMVAEETFESQEALIEESEEWEVEWEIDFRDHNKVLSQIKAIRES
jgi:hypothetical protein